MMSHFVIYSYSYHRFLLADTGTKTMQARLVADLSSLSFPTVVFYPMDISIVRIWLIKAFLFFFSIFPKSFFYMSHTRPWEYICFIAILVIKNQFATVEVSAASKIMFEPNRATIYKINLIITNLMCFVTNAPCAARNRSYWDNISSAFDIHFSELSSSAKLFGFIWV